MTEQDSRKTAPKAAPEVSVVVWLFNQCPTVAEIYDRLTRIFGAVGRSYEIVFVDDASTDGTDAQLQWLARSDVAVQVVTLARRSGQLVALAAGFDRARGQAIVAIDGDLTNDSEAVEQIAANLDEGYELGTAWRARAHDDYRTRRALVARATRSSISAPHSTCTRAA